MPTIFPKKIHFIFLVFQTLKKKLRYFCEIFLIFLTTLTPFIGATILYQNRNLWPKDTIIHNCLISEPRSIISRQKNFNLNYLNGELVDLHIFQGKWTILSIDSSISDEKYLKKLFIARNCHASQGKYVNRISRVWIIADACPIIPKNIINAYPGTIILRSDKKQNLQKHFFPEKNPDSFSVEDFIWIIDPMGNLIFHFNENTDPIKICKIIKRLVSKSNTGSI